MGSTAITSVNPATGEPIGEVPELTRQAPVATMSAYVHGHVAVAAVLATAAVFGACSFQVSSSTSVDARDPDAAIDGRELDATIPLGPWGTPTLVGINSIYVDDDPSLTDDQLELYFGSDRPGSASGGFEDIWVATRGSVSDPWGVPAPLNSLNSSSTETTMKVSGDGLTIMFASNRGLGGTELYVATRPNRQAGWGTPELAVELNSTATDYAPQLSQNGLRVVLSSFRSGANEQLYASGRASIVASWSVPVEISELSTPGTESDPMEPDAETIYFTTDRAGTLDLYMATRTATTTYGVATPVTELNTIGIDRDAWVSADHRTMYFSSNRNGNFEIYVSTR